MLWTQTSVTGGRKKEEKAKFQEANTRAHETAIESQLLQGQLALNTVLEL